jgi:hypothetical protein
MLLSFNFYTRFVLHAAITVLEYSEQDDILTFSSEFYISLCSQITN